MSSIGAKLDRLLWRIPERIPGHTQTRTLAVGESCVRIRDTGGAGQTLVFLCDPPVTVEAYDDLIQAFGSDVRVVIMELPGFGFSRINHADQLSFAGAVATVEAALVSLSLESMVLFGPCVCGFVVTELAARKNLPIQGLVLMQTPDKAGMLSWVERMDPKGLLRLPLIGQLLVKFNASRMAKFWFKYATAKAFDASGITHCTKLALKQGGGYPLASMLQLWTKGTRNAAVKIPGLIVWGMQDRSHATTSPCCSHAHLTNADLVELPGCGHFSELENPAQFVATVLPFLARINKTRRVD